MRKRQEKIRNAAINESGFQNNTGVKRCHQTRCLNISPINVFINLKSEDFKIKKETWEKR